MRDEQAFEQAIREIQEALNQAESHLGQLDGDFQFLVGTGDLEIVRRGRKGDTLRPKIVVAELKGCDPVLWRPEHPAWMYRFEPGLERRDVPTKGGNGQPASGDDDEPRPPGKPRPVIPEEN